MGRAKACPLAQPLGKSMMNMNNVWRLILLLSSLFFIASCWTPIYKRQTMLIPMIPDKVDRTTILSETRSLLANVLDNIAEQNNLQDCRFSLANRKIIAEYCTPNVGVNYMLRVRATQLIDRFEIVVEEPDTTAFFKAKESNRLRKVWNELLTQLDEKWPGRVKHSCEDGKKCKSIIEYLY